MEQYKIINDPIYGHIKLDSRLFTIIDTPVFQRLRDLKQLGGMYFVFPGAAHNRFEHSIGTSYLAGEWMKRFKDKQPELEITDKDVLLVQIAGLCHDLGHGPFSHMFQDIYVKRNKELKGWKHEQASCDLLKLIIEDSKDNEKLLDEEDLEIVKHLIMGTVPEIFPNQKKFMFQIVCNKTNSIDVDKMDYLVRDTHSAGLPLGFSVSRILDNSIVFGTDICFDERGVFNVAQMFISRYGLHKEVYSHAVVESIELMIGDVFKKVEDMFQINKILKDMTSCDQEIKKQGLIRYALLTDSLLKMVERTEDPSNGNLAAAKALIERIQTRRHYKYMGGFAIPKNSTDEIDEHLDSLQNFLQEEIANYHVIIKKRSINFAMKDKNPLLAILFYSGNEDEKPKRKTLKEISPILSADIDENQTRVYLTVLDQDIQDKVFEKLSRFEKSSGNSIRAVRVFSPKSLRKKPRCGKGRNMTPQKLFTENPPTQASDNERDPKN